MQKTFELLIVEDDLADVDLIKEALNLTSNRAFDIHLSNVEDGDQAISFLKKENAFSAAPSPDLILLDLNMPRKGGHDVLREIKTDERFKGIPVVVLTTSSSSADVKLSYQLGANSYITKARNFTDFSRVVKTIEDYWLNVVSLPRV